MEGSYPLGPCSQNLEELILSNQIGGGFRDTLTSIHTSTANVTSAVDRAAIAGVTETARGASVNLQSTERNGGETRSSVERNGGETRSTVERNGNETRETVNRNGNEIRDIVDRFSLATCHDFADVRREAVEHKYQLTLQAAENAARISAQIAECCCEQKELTRAQGSETRALISENEQNRLRDALAAANQSLLLLQVNAAR